MSRKINNAELNWLIDDINDLHEYAEHASQAAKKSVEACHRIASDVCKHLSSRSDKANAFSSLPEKFEEDSLEFTEESKNMRDYADRIRETLRRSIQHLNGDEKQQAPAPSTMSSPGLLVKMGTLFGVGDIVRGVQLIIGVFMAIAGMCGTDI
jgi:hypothetical protein